MQTRTSYELSNGESNFCEAKCLQLRPCEARKRLRSRGASKPTSVLKQSGGDSKEVPPVPMPNTEVKLLNVDDTWWVTARESRKLPELTTTLRITATLSLSLVFKYIPL